MHGRGHRKDRIQEAGGWEAWSLDGHMDGRAATDLQPAAQLTGSGNVFLETGAVLSLAAQCAPAVAPHTIAALVVAESPKYVFAFNVNDVASQPHRPPHEDAGIATAPSYMARVYRVDLGTGPTNPSNMPYPRLTWN